MWDSAVRAEGTEHNFRISIHNSWDEKSRNLWNWSTIYETAPQPFPSFPVQRPIWRAGPDSAIPWPPDSNLVPQITTRIRRQSQKLRINPEIVQQESHLFSMSPSPTNYGLPTESGPSRGFETSRRRPQKSVVAPSSSVISTAATRFSSRPERPCGSAGRSTCLGGSRRFRARRSFSRGVRASSAK